MKNRILGFALTCSIVLTSFGGVVFAAEKKATEFTENFETNASTKPNEAFETENAAVFSSENNYTVRQDDYRKHGGGYSLKFSRTSAEPLTISNAFSAVSKGQSPARIEVSVWLEAEQLSDGGKNRAVSVTAEIVTDQETAASSEVLVNTDNDFNNSHEGFEDAVFSFDIKDATNLEKSELTLVI